jgi:hypothetical protein
MKFLIIGLLAIGGASIDTALAQDLEPVSLNSFSNAPDGIATAIVNDQLGRTIGIVARVELKTDGRLKQVDVLMPGGRHMVIDSTSASYDAETHRVIANLPVTQTVAADTDLRG